MSDQYTLIFKNESPENLIGVVFQQPPPDNPSAMSLAWLVKPAFPKSSARFSWELDYGFVWANTGQLRPGVRFMPNQDFRADLSNSNQISFNGTTFYDQKPGPQPGSLVISEDPQVPFNVDAVGISLSGQALLANQAAPNRMDRYTPSDRYWIATGNFQQGEVLDAGSLRNAAQVSFPPGVDSMTATYNPNGTWTIQPTP
jgi:hypothetical protein